MENFIVSARKYRPQKFSDVSSQEFVTQTLKNAIITNKIAHSYLLSGPRGVGKTTIARIFAKALNCPDQKDGEPCNNCVSCEEITRGIHPDVFELDAASNRGIDDVRAIQDAAKFYPAKGKYKFFIVDEVHMLTQQAFNALLKILEEPPSYLIFILATTNPEKIPATIVSRCQRFILQRFKIEEIKEKLREVAKEEKVKIDDDALFQIAKLGDGALRDALGIFDMAVSYCGNSIKYNELKNFLNLPDKENYFKISGFIREGNANEMLNYFNDMSEKGFDLQSFYNGLIEHLRNLLIIRSTKNPSHLNETDLIRKLYLEESEGFTQDQILRLLKILIEAESRFKFSSNQKILFESILIELCRINKEVVDLSTIISDLKSLKSPHYEGVSEPETLTEDKNYRTESSNGKKENKKEESKTTIENSEVVKKLKELFDIDEFDVGDQQK